MNLKHKILIILLIGFLTSCDLLNKEENTPTGVPVARVYDSYLYKDDLIDIIPKSLSEEDSLAFVKNYINVWGKDQLMIYKAEFNLADADKRFEAQIEEFRNDLLKYAYQEQYIQQNMDTVVTITQIQEYYEANGDNFQLNENIVQPEYTILNKDAPKIGYARKWFNSGKTEDKKKLREYALQYGARHVWDDTTWISYEQLARIIPIQTYNQQDFLGRTRKLELADSVNIYLLEINSYKIQDSQAPLTYVSDIIRNIILNQRKLETIDRLEQNLIGDALEKNEFETYE